MTLALLAAWLGACSAGETHDGQDALAHKPLIGPRDVVRGDLPLPTSLASAQLRPWAGEQLARADLTGDEAVARLELPEYLAVGIEQVAQNPPDPLDAPPGKALKHYLAGRSAYLKGERDVAVEQLGLALNIDPASARALSMLGQVRFNATRPDDSRDLFERALQLDPDQPHALFFNGQIVFQEKKFDEAAVLTHRLVNLRGRPVDAGVSYMGSYHAGLSLARLGYDRAAIEHLAAYLQEGERFTGNTRFIRQIAVVGRQRGVVMLQAGDALLRLGRVQQALEYYAQAEQTERLRPELINHRRVYALLLLGRSEEAEQVVIDELGREKADEKSLPLVGYVKTHTDDPQRFAKRLRRAYAEGNRRALLARAAMEVLDSDGSADTFMVDMLAANPSQVDVYETWLERVGTDDTTRVLATTLRLVERVPQRAREIGGALLEQTKDAKPWLDAIAALDEIERDRPATWFLRGLCEAYDRRAEDAERSFNAALDRDPDYTPAVLATVDLAIRQGKHDAALAMIAAHDESAMPRLKFYRVVALQAKADFAQKSGDANVSAALRQQAMGLINQLIASAPDDNEYRLAKAGLLRRARDFAGAERELLDILKRNDKYELAYETLFLIYERESRDGEKFVQLLVRARRAIPHARITRLKLAQVFRGRREFNEAESLLRSLLRDNTRDAVAMRELVLLFRQQDRTPDAQAALVDLLEREPDNAPAMLLLREVARQTGDTEAYFVRYEAYLNYLDDELARHLQLARLYAEWGKQDRQIAALEAALAIDPPNAAAIYLQLAFAHQQAERFDDALAASDKAIELKPDMVEAYATKGYLLLQQERGGDAVAMYRDAIRAGAANRLGLREQLADLQYRLGRLDEALAEIDRVIAAAPARRVELTYRQASYANADAPRAERYLEQVLKLDPDHVGANNDLAYVWADTGRNLAKAEQMMRKVIAAEPEQPAYIDSLGWVLYKQGRFARAVAWLGKAYRHPDGKDAVIIDHYGDALWRAGQAEAAEARWREALATFGEPATDRPLLADEKKLRTAIEAKLEALDAGKEPPVAPVPQAVEEDAPPDPPLPDVQ